MDLVYAGTDFFKFQIKKVIIVTSLIHFSFHSSILFKRIHLFLSNMLQRHLLIGHLLLDTITALFTIPSFRSAFVYT